MKKTKTIVYEKYKNPLLTESKLPFQVIDFPSIKLHHYTKAIKIGIQESNRVIKKICSNPNPPTFENTILPLEYDSKILSRAQSAYTTLHSAHSDDKFRALGTKIFALLSKQENRVISNKKLFSRIQHIYNSSHKLDYQEKRIVELYYKNYLRSGATLSQSKLRKLKQINIKLNLLSPAFSKNAIKAINSFFLHIPSNQKDKLEGLPPHVIEIAKALAKEKKRDGYIFTLQPPSYIPFLTYCKDRELRKKLYYASATKNCFGKYSNCSIIKKIITLREERAHLLGYKTHAHYILEQRMAKNPETVFDFLSQLENAYLLPAKKELESIKEEAYKSDHIEKQEFMPWDFSYYANALRLRRFNFDTEEFRPYLKTENVLEGLFAVANKLYQLSFIKREDIPTYHKDVFTYEVVKNTNEVNKTTIGLLYFDLYPRATKQSGAWMNDMRSQYKENEINNIPLILICANLTPPTNSRPSLLSYDEANTLFHEFGHALHGLLSNVTYPSIASPNVFWDFVELPSQIMENYLTKQECLALFAKEYKSGAPLPQELFDKLNNSLYFNEGYMGLRQVMLAYLDMKWHTSKAKEIKDVLKFEEDQTKRFSLLPHLPQTAISPSFSHIFAGGYSAGYYSYKWAERLDADAFSYFEQEGIFNKSVAQKFERLLSLGNAIEPMELYKEFRGKEPTIEALLKRVRTKP